MNFAEKPRPVVYCAGATCRACLTAVGMSCTKADCDGAYRSGTGSDDWTKCAACEASGWELTRHVRPRLTELTVPVWQHRGPAGSRLPQTYLPALDQIPARVC